MTWHQTIVVGNLGGDPELRYMQRGDAVCNFSVAVSERWRDRQSGDQRERTTWYRVAVWGPQAESCNTYLSRGSKVLVTGNVTARGYVNNNGEAAASLDLRARDVRFMSSRSDSDQGGGNWQGGGRQQQQGNWQGGGQQQRGGQQQARRPAATRRPTAARRTAPRIILTSPTSVDDIPF